MYYRHNLDYEYPDAPDEHMITVKQVRETHFDEHYAYRPKGCKHFFSRLGFFLTMNLLVFPVCRVRYGLRIFGKENIRKHKAELKNGAITVSNHVFMWDYICVLRAIRPHLSYFPAWKTNFEGPLGPMIRWAGGIPVPTQSFRAMRKFHHCMEELLREGKWIHFFPEGSLWFYYPDIRPLKKAVFVYAQRHEKPILPVTLSFRPRKGIFRLFGKSPLVDVHVGAPMYADPELDREAAVEELRSRAYSIMQMQNGIHPGDPTYNTDLDGRNYRKTM